MGFTMVIFLYPSLLLSSVLWYSVSKITTTIDELSSSTLSSSLFMMKLMPIHPKTRKCYGRAHTHPSWNQTSRYIRCSIRLYTCVLLCLESHPSKCWVPKQRYYCCISSLDTLTRDYSSNWWWYQGKMGTEQIKLSDHHFLIHQGLFAGHTSMTSESLYWSICSCQKKIVYQISEKDMDSSIFVGGTLFADNVSKVVEIYHQTSSHHYIHQYYYRVGRLSGRPSCHVEKRFLNSHKKLPPATIKKHVNR